MNKQSEEEEFEMRRDLSKTVDFEIANREVARQHRINSELRQDNKKRFPVCSTDIEEIGQFGIGLQLYFRMLRSLALVLMIMTILAGAAFISNQLGNYFSGDDSASFLYFGIIAN